MAASKLEVAPKSLAKPTRPMTSRVTHSVALSSAIGIPFAFFMALISRCVTCCTSGNPFLQGSFKKLNQGGIQIGGINNDSHS